MTLTRVSLLVCAAAAAFAAPKPDAPTYHKDILPVFQKRCQECHRLGEAAPMPFLSYQQVRPWAKAIREAVVSRRMPPWPADPRFGKFSNDRSLEANEVELIRAWVDAGAPAGDPNDAPPPATFADGWAMATPDAVFELPHEFQVQASGTIEYQYIVIPTGVVSILDNFPGICYNRL